MTCENAVCTKTTEEKTEPGSVEEGDTCTDPVDCVSRYATDTNVPLATYPIYPHNIEIGRLYGCPMCRKTGRTYEAG